jgi:hypothetical protein
MIMLSFDQWWEANKAAFERTIGTDSEPLFSHRDIAHAAWLFGSLSFSQTINQALDENLERASHDI